MKYNFCLLVIMIIVLALILHIYQIETPEQFYSVENFTDLLPSDKPEPEPKPESESELLEQKSKTIQRLTDKLKSVNVKMAEFEKIKPVKASVYANLFENQLPEYYKKSRSDMTNMYYDISQDIQDKRLENIDTKIGSIAQTVNMSQDKGIVSKLGSVKSHLYGKTLNLIHNPNETYTIPINNGCLFVINNENGEVDYDITNFSRNDKNKICLPEASSQQFKINKINNLEGYKKIIGATLNEEPLDSKYITYPFYVIQPLSNDKHCLEIGHDGVHFEECNTKKSQRWEGSQNAKSCGCTK